MTQTIEEWDAQINEAEALVAAARARVRHCSDRSKLADKDLDAAIKNWNAEFPVKSAVDVHKENCARDAQRKLDNIAAGLPAVYQGETRINKSVVDAVASGGRGSINQRYGQNFRRGSAPAHLLGTRVKMPSEK